MENLNNAITIFGLNEGHYKLEDIKKIYRVLASNNHPDKGGNTETMQLINNAYNDFVEFFTDNQTLNVDNQHSGISIDFEFIKELKLMQGIIIEICGVWVWLSGNTFPFREQIKNLGFKFSGTKKSWYWSPTIDELIRRRGSKSMKSIRQKYGSEIIATERIKAIN